MRPPAAAKILALLLVLGNITPASLGAADSSPDPGAVDQQTAAAVTEAVLAVNEAMRTAGNEGDVETLFARIADVANPIIQDGRLFATREEALQVVKQGYQGIESIERDFEKPTVTVLSSTLALLTATGTSRVTLQDGRTFTNPFAVTLVFVLKNGEWQVLHGHYSVPNR